MPDVIDQLRQLGEAAEAHVETVTPHEVLVAPTGRGGWGRWSSLRSVGAAAAAVVGLVVLGVGVSRVIDDPNEVVTSAVASESSAVGSDSEASVAEQLGGLTPLASDRSGWQELRDCESSSDYAANSGNGFFGAYQFDSGSWTTMMGTLGIEGYDEAHQAPPAIQDAAAAELYALQGAKPWPVCGRSISGPMSSPIVHGWIDQPSAMDLAVAGRNAPGLIVFMRPDITNDQRAAVEGEIRRWGREPGANLDDWMYIDKEEALAEFRALFEGSPDLVDNVTVDQLPTSYRVTFAGDGLPDLDRLRGLAGVQRVIGDASEQLVSVAFGAAAVPVDLKSVISDASLLGAVVPYDPWYFAPIEPVIELGPITLAGHGEDPSDPFYGLSELSAGDVIALQIDDLHFDYVVETNAEVSADDPTEPTESETLTLTTEGSDRSLRRVVTARVAS